MTVRTEAHACDAAQALPATRDDCSAPGGDGLVLDALAQCLADHAAPPQWLADAFVDRYSRVVNDSEVRSWDEVFGKPRAARTRHRHQRLKREIHDLVRQEYQSDDRVTVCRDLFAYIADLLKEGVSASLCEQLYYAAIHEGAPSISHLRAAAKRDCSIPNFCPTSWDSADT